MAEFAPVFSDLGNIIPKNTTPLHNSEVNDELLDTAVGAAAGSAALATRAQVPATADNGGKMNAVTVNLINRNSTAGDVTALKSKFRKKNPSFTFVRDLSGNGGPAFTRS